jgi:hypothetical protein
MSTIDDKFTQYLSSLADVTAAAILKAAVETMPEAQKRQFIIDNCPVTKTPEANAAPEEEFNTGYEGAYKGRSYEIINQGMFGNGNVDWRMLKFKDNGEELPLHKSVLAKEVLEATDDMPMKQWNVPIMRIGYGHALIAVSARTEQEAIDLAIDEAGGESFSENSSEYEAPDGAHEIK